MFGRDAIPPGSLRPGAQRFFNALLVNRGELIGLDRQQLEEKLGRPSRQVGVSREVADQTYWLGYESACIDSRWLAVKFDADGHVETARIAAD